MSAFPYSEREVDGNARKWPLQTVLGHGSFPNSLIYNLQYINFTQNANCRQEQKNMAWWRLFITIPFNSWSILWHLFHSLLMRSTTWQSGHTNHCLHLGRHKLWHMFSYMTLDRRPLLRIKARGFPSSNTLKTESPYWCREGIRPEIVVSELLWRPHLMSFVYSAWIESRNWSNLNSNALRIKPLRLVIILPFQYQPWAPLHTPHHQVSFCY